MAKHKPRPIVRPKAPEPRAPVLPPLKRNINSLGSAKLRAGFGWSWLILSFLAGATAFYSVFLFRPDWIESGKHAELESQISSLNKSLDESRASLDQLAETREQMRYLLLSRQRLEDELKSSKNSYSALAAGNAKLQSGLESANQQLLTAQERLEQASGDAKVTQIVLNNELELARSQTEQNSTEISRLEALLEQAAQDSSNMSAQLSNLQDQLAAKDQAAENLRQQSLSARRDNQELRAGFSEEKRGLLDELDSMRAQVDTANRDLERLKVKVREDAEQAELERQRSKQLLADRSELERLLGQRDKRVEALEKELATEKTRTEALEREFAAERTRMEALEKEFASEKARMGPLEKELATETIRSTLQRWAKVWSQGDPDGYLAHYAEVFVPAQGTRAEWEAQKRWTLRRSGSIRVSLSDIDIAVDGDQAVARFVQDYRSSTYQDRVRKTLVFALINGEWMIIEERSEA